MLKCSEHPEVLGFLLSAIAAIGIFARFWLICRLFGHKIPDDQRYRPDPMCARCMQVLGEYD